MRIKAFDLGTFMGSAVVVGQPGGKAELTYFSLLRFWGRGKAEIKDWQRWPVARKGLEGALTATLAVDGFDAVYYEMPVGVMKNRAAARVLTGLELALEEVCGRLGVPLTGVPQPALKLWGTCTLPRGTCDHNVKAKPRTCTGRGNAKKPEMIYAARALWGVDLGGDDNVADAALLAGYAAERAGMILPSSSLVGGA